jgi:hypothetical protein
MACTNLVEIEGLVIVRFEHKEDSLSIKALFYNSLKIWKQCALKIIFFYVLHY